MSGLSMLAEPEAMADMASGGQVAVAAAQTPVVKWEVTRAHSMYRCALHCRICTVDTTPYVWKAGTYMRQWLPSEDELMFEVVAKNMGPLPVKTEPVKTEGRRDSLLGATALVACAGFDDAIDPIDEVHSALLIVDHLKSQARDLDAERIQNSSSKLCIQYCLLCDSESD
jgi:hypothetical protein